MTIGVTEYINVRERLAKLGCQDPDGFALLPINFDTANSFTDFRQVAEAATVKTLLRSVDVPLSDILPSEKRPPYVQNNGLEWVAPTLFVAAQLISENPNYVSVALSVIADYITSFFRGISGERVVKLGIIVEKTDKKTCKRISYDGPVEGLKDLTELVRTIRDE